MGGHHRIPGAANLLRPFVGVDRSAIYSRHIVLEYGGEVNQPTNLIIIASEHTSRVIVCYTF